MSVSMYTFVCTYVGRYVHVSAIGSKYVPMSQSPIKDENFAIAVYKQSCVRISIVHLEFRIAAVDV